MRIDAVFLDNFRPFANQRMEFPPSDNGAETGEVHLLIGENGTGKTRLLCVLAAACGNASDLEARTKGKGAHARVAAVVGDKRCIWDRQSGRVCILATSEPFAELLPRPIDNIPTSTRAQSLLDVNSNELAGSALAFRGTVRASDSQIVAMQSVEIGDSQAHLSFEPGENEDRLVCQTMANLKMGAAMESMAKRPRPQLRSLRIVERLESAISQVTGREFEFEVTPHPEVQLRVFWGGVPMRLCELPDGLRSIIGWLVSCIAKLQSQFPEAPNPLNVPLILLLDEPESHLHPAWQRKLLPAAQALLPHSQMFVATHSPFVISSVNNGWIHVFRADQRGTVTVEKPRPCSEGDSYLDVVEDILGVKEWYDPETEQLLAEFRAARDKVISGGGDVEQLQTKADAIASRSDSLRELMAREMHQVHRLAKQGVGAG